jgi:hypothetical protein
MWRFSGFQKEYDLSDFPLGRIVPLEQGGIEELGKKSYANGRE